LYQIIIRFRGLSIEMFVHAKGALKETDQNDHR